MTRIVEASGQRSQRGKISAMRRSPLTPITCHARVPTCGNKGFSHEMVTEVRVRARGHHFLRSDPPGPPHDVWDQLADYRTWDLALNQ